MQWFLLCSQSNQKMAIYLGLAIIEKTWCTFSLIPNFTWCVQWYVVCSRYLCGLAYYEHGNRYFPSDCPECIVVHNNWIVGREAKIYRFKEHLTWMIDDDSYYRSSKRKYISYHNPMKWSSQQETENEELDALKSALAIGKLLDRIVILPRFHCDGKECPLNSLISVAAFDNQFSGKYRENSFPRHPWIPPSLKKPANVSHMIITPNNSHFSKNLTKQVNGRVLDTTGSGIVNESQLRANFDDFIWFNSTVCPPLPSSCCLWERQIAMWFPKIDKRGISAQRVSPILKNFKAMVRTRGIALFSNCCDCPVVILDILFKPIRVLFSDF